MIRNSAILMALIAWASGAFADPPLPSEALHRFGSARFQMGATVVSAGFTSDGKAVFTGTQTGLIVKTEVATGKELGRGLVNYNSADALRMAGKSTEQIEQLLGKVPYVELLHRDNFAASI